MSSRYILFGSLLTIATNIYAQNVAADNDSIFKDEELMEVSVTANKIGTTRMAGVMNGMNLNKAELFKAACCNLGESFTTNPSVDVAYSDATTGARQIRLLGLSGTYVQMLTENIPNFRGAAIPYALGYVPGPWMNGIQVSKGAASVKNGYESITGQINIDYLQPEAEEKVEANFFADSKSRIEANANANVHLSGKWSTEVLLHHENILENHDDNNDGFYDMPGREQYNIHNRWVYKGDKYVFHGGIGALKEIRTSGQDEEHIGKHVAHHNDIYRIKQHTNRYEGYMKHAFILDRDHGTNIALMSSASLHQADALYGNKRYDLNEKSVYGSLMFETSIHDRHNMSLGLSINHDYLHQPTFRNERETTPGAYAQYTYTLGSRLTAMAGIRIDHSSIYGTFLTPRFHLKYSPVDAVSFRLSAGKGYRTVFQMAEYGYLLASGRQLQVADRLQQEEAWNYGISSAFYIPLGGKTLKLNTEYYYTRFNHQAVVDYDMDPSSIFIHDLHGKSYSHTFQVDATYPIFKGMDITAAYRLNDVKCSYGTSNILKEKPLTSRYKALFTASYKTPLALWQIDATLQLNGGGRNPDTFYGTPSQKPWQQRFHSYEQLSMQITRWFRHWSIYIGGENLTGFKQKTPIYNASMPWSADFEPTLVWGPVEGRMMYAGVRVNF